MKFPTAAVFLFVILFEIGEPLNPLAYHNVIFGWKEITYKFPSSQTLNRVLKTGEFIAQNNVITGVKVGGSKIFLTVPRWREGVPSTLNYVDFDVSKDDQGGEIKSPPLIPYPSWEMNQVGNCKAFQYIQSMEIDQFDRMWVVDVGRINILSPNRTAEDDKCPPKLILIDITNGEILHTYIFPQDVVSPKGNFLNDIAVGCETKSKCIAYISDAMEAKIIVYNYEENRSWFLHHSSMLVNEDQKDIKILGNDFKFNVNIDGLSLSPLDRSFDRLYYCPLSGLNLYSVPTTTLKQAVNGITLKDSDVTNHGSKSSQSDGIIMDSTGLLFYGLLNANGVSYLNTTSSDSLPQNEVLFLQNDIDLQWPDTLGFDTDGYLYVTSNRLQRFRGNNYDTSEINFRISRVYTGHKSYMYSAKKSIEEASPKDIPSDVLNATPKINLDDKTVYQYEVPSSSGDDHEHHHESTTTTSTPSPIMSSTTLKAEIQPRDENNLEHHHGEGRMINSSVPVNPYSGALVFVLAVFVFHPVI